MFYRENKDLWVERVTINGKQKEIAAKTKAKLKQKLLAVGDQVEKSAQFDTVAAAWEEAKAAQLAYNTYESYKPHIARAVSFFGTTPVSDVTPAEVQAFVDSLAAQGYAKDTVRRAKEVCNMIFNYAITLPGSSLRFNPCSAVTIPRGLKKTRREPPTAEQLMKISPDSEMGLFAWFLLYTGLRRGELLALRWEDIDRENKLIHVNKAVYFENNQPHTKETKTEAGTRDVELLDILLEALPDKKQGYVFGGKQPWTAYQVNRKWLEWCKSVGLAEEEKITHYNENNKHSYTTIKYKPMVTCHQFRHEYASMLEDAGVPEFSAKTALGHSSISVTKDIYTHIRNRKSARIGGKLNEYIKEQNQK